MTNVVNKLKRFGVDELLLLMKFINDEAIDFDKWHLDLGTVEHNNDHGSLFLKPQNELFSRMCYHRDPTGFISITLYGDFSMTVEDLTDRFGDPMEQVVQRDELLFYHFTLFDKMDLLSTYFDQPVEPGHKKKFVMNIKLRLS